MSINKYGSLASFLLAVSFLVAPLIYLMGNLRDALGIMAYELADFLYGPAFSVGIFTVVYVFREKLAGKATRRMDLALYAAALSALGMAAVAFIRAANRGYHIAHPELNLEDSTTVLLIWTTLVAGVNAVGFHFLGWAWLLVGSANWSVRSMPRLLNVLYFLAGCAALFVYQFPVLEGAGVLLGIIIFTWQGFWFWNQET